MAHALSAQRPDSAVKPPQAAADPRDSLFVRARKLVLDGNGAKGRTLVDSALTAATGPADSATALYWRGSLAPTASGAERDYRRVIVEYPFSPHSGDALLALAQLEMARGDRDPAIDHLQRFLLQRPNDPERVRAGIWLGRLLLEQNQVTRGCAVLLRTRAALGDTAVETRNQVDYYAGRCAGVDTVAPVVRAPPPARTVRPDTARRRVPVADSARVDTTTRRPPARRDSVRPQRRDSVHRDSARTPARNRDSVVRDGARRETATPGGGATVAKRYTVQVAAYDTKESAIELVSRLSARGIVARVVNSPSAPYRVRVGHYATDAEATAAMRELKDKGITGFVTTTDNESAPAPVKK
jgi:cell division septation protein DedD